MDQDKRRVGGISAGAIVCALRRESGTVFDGVVIGPLLVLGRCLAGLIAHYGDEQIAMLVVRTSPSAASC